MTYSPVLLCVVGFVGGCFVLPADSSPPRVGPGRCRGVTTLINCLLSPVCMASCLPCRHVLRGFRVAEVAAKNWRRGAEEVREGEVCSGVVSRVCLNSSVAVSNMDHGWTRPDRVRCSGLGYCCLPFTALLIAIKSRQMNLRQPKQEQMMLERISFYFWQ